ncbi:anthranilate synthase component I family protein [Lacibacter luteus]|uniref:Anthranilate synthase component I family protein n=1 Tax=Lacibacter luteus TaxID=2508719 RepID=A0A4Q1CF40_9BACT|nr:anthranilate synthase component I family protein [Lacibacter luteus]RXK58514.1 anthranilate synthase component I family protein [Lacibacter luteus]
MKHNFRTYLITDFSVLKQQMLSWCNNRFNICSFLDNHHYRLPGNSYECLVGCGEISVLQLNAGTALEQLQQWLLQHEGEWRFGHLGYDLKTEIESLPSLHENKTGFSDLCFFVPEYVFQLSETELKIGSVNNDQDLIFHEIKAEQLSSTQTKQPLQIKERISKEVYVDTIETIRKHILRGDCYELNYCMEFFAENAVLDPLQCYKALTTISPNPFSAFYKVSNSYLLCASPERFLRKEGSRLISQPIKGTIKRNNADAVADDLLKQQLYKSAKDRSENVMVVDLVRNDLSRVCKEGTVQVDELFGIYSFPQLYQMISTISGQVNEALSFTDILRATFPMGSMTGAPKRKVMQLIELYEQTRRGLFSGAVGYIAPTGDFDFNVVIRSIFYNAVTNYLSYIVGSGITFYSNAEQEYDECLLKADAIRKVLS